MSQPEPVFYAEEAHGYRAWRLDLDDGNARLLSLRPYITSPPWPANEPLEAWCVNHEAAPVDGGRCGIYAWETFKQMEHNTRWGRYRGLVLGEVALWGRTFKHQWGYRAQFARPTTIYLPPRDVLLFAPAAKGVAAKHYDMLRDRLARAADTYDVPLVSFAEEGKGEPADGYHPG